MNARTAPNMAALAALAACFLAAGVAAWFANGYYVFIIANMALTAIVGIGLNVLIGLTGQVSFGHVGFYAIGAYTVAILTTAAKWPLAAALPLGALLAAAMGALLALPALRVRGPYLAMVTIAFGFMVEQGAVEWRVLTGGQNGIMGVPPLNAFGESLGERGVALAGTAFAALLTWIYWRLRESPLGRAMQAARDSETAAASIGLNPVILKGTAFALSALCAGLAGGLFAPLAGFVTPSTFAFSQSILFVLVVMIGGAGTVAGPLVGALVVVLLPEFLASLAEYRLLLFGALMLLVLWAAPQGLVGACARWFRGRPAVLESPPSTTPPEHGGHNGAGLEVAGLGIAFGGLKAVTDLGFHAPRGRVTALIGPNGAGKTTVLNMLSGFYRPDAGTIRLGGQTLEGLPAWRIARAGVARTYQTSQLFGSLSVLDNLVAATSRGTATPPFAPGNVAAHEESVRRATALASFVGYRGDLLRPASDLPLVDRRLVEIGRALATNPAVLLLDEPAAGLSREEKARLGTLLRAIADSGIAVVLVEHDMSLVMSLSDQVVVIDAGQRIAAGTPAEVQDDSEVRRAYLGHGAGTPRAEDVPRPAPSGEVLLGIGALRAGYGGTAVLHGIDIELHEREMVAVLGANGAGKSTLMRAVVGLLRPVSGSITLAGADMQALPAHRATARGLILVPEGRQVFPELSVADNIRLGAFLRRDRGAIERDIMHMFERFPRLAERAGQRAGLLSGGEQQMLAIARGLMGSPRVLLLDEPSLGLAPAIIEELFAVLDRLREEGVTLLLVDQMAGLALSLADRAYVMENGRIVAQGSAAEVRRDDVLEKAYLGA